MQITMKISESLLSIYKSTGKDFDEIFFMESESSISVKDIILKAGISPMLTPMIIVNNKSCGSINEMIVEDSTITLIGPLAGG